MFALIVIFIIGLYYNAGQEHKSASIQSDIGMEQCVWLVPPLVHSNTKPLFANAHQITHIIMKLRNVYSVMEKSVELQISLTQRIGSMERMENKNIMKI